MSESMDPIKNTRISDARSGYELVTAMRRADDFRSMSRTEAMRQVDGNQPYNQAELVRLGQGWRSNFNPREAESLLAQGVGGFYDLSTEAATLVEVICEHGPEERRFEYSEIMTEEWDKTLREDKKRDYRTQLFQREMTLFGMGPLVWEDDGDFRPTAIPAMNIHVPDKTKSDVNEWNACTIVCPYTVNDAWHKIEDEEIASKAGWNVAMVKASIKKADNTNGQKEQSWEEMQLRLRNNDILTGAQCANVKWCHLFYRERDGKITHCIIDENNTEKWIYHRKDKYKKWSNVINPMYYDIGNGTHHSVKGMGVKMSNAIARKNRLMMDVYDAASIGTGLMIQPKTEKAAKSSSVIPKGGYTVLPPDHEVVQQQLAGQLDAPRAVIQDLQALLQSNLSQYRQDSAKPQGNPRTATEISTIVAQQHSMSKTQYNRYYEQTDSTSEEEYSRAVGPMMSESNEGGRMAKAYIKRCRDRGVPMEAIRGAKVKTTRVAGQGSPMLRKEGLFSVAPFVGGLPEVGQKNWYKDTFAVTLGRESVKRYYPDTGPTANEQDQMSLIQLEHSAMKSGVQPVVTSTQLQMLHAVQHIHMGAASVSSVEQNPEGVHEVASFLIILRPHIEEHLQKLSTDPTKQQVIEPLLEQYKALSAQADEIIKLAQSTPPPGQQPPQQPPPTVEEQIKIQKFQAEEQRKQATHDHDMSLKGERAALTNSLADAKTAAKINRDRIEAESTPASNGK